MSHIRFRTDKKRHVVNAYVAPRFRIAIVRYAEGDDFSQVISQLTGMLMSGTFRQDKSLAFRVICDELVTARAMKPLGYECHFCDDDFKCCFDETGNCGIYRDGSFFAYHDSMRDDAGVDVLLHAVQLGLISNACREIKRLCGK